MSLTSIKGCSNHGAPLEWLETSSSVGGVVYRALYREAIWCGDRIGRAGAVQRNAEALGAVKALFGIEAAECLNAVMPEADPKALRTAAEYRETVPSPATPDRDYHAELIEAALAIGGLADAPHWVTAGLAAGVADSGRTVREISVGEWLNRIEAQRARLQEIATYGEQAGTDRARAFAGTERDQEVTA